MRLITKCAALAIPVALALGSSLPAAAQTAASTVDLSKVLVCRPANTSEKPMAMMGTEALVCKPLSIVMKNHDGTSTRIGNMKATPATCDTLTGLTAEQQTAEMKACLGKVFGGSYSNGSNIGNG